MRMLCGCEELGSGVRPALLLEQGVARVVDEVDVGLVHVALVPVLVVVNEPL